MKNTPKIEASVLLGDPVADMDKVKLTFKPLHENGVFRVMTLTVTRGGKDPLHIMFTTEDARRLSAALHMMFGESFDKREDA